MNFTVTLSGSSPGIPNISHLHSTTVSVAHLLGWTTIWLIRYRLSDHTATQDAFLFALVGVWRLRAELSLTLQSANIVPLTIFTSFMLLYTSLKLKKRFQDFDAVEEDVAKENSNWMKPTIIPCSTTHTRYFPKKHSFSYSYLCVGIPVDWNGRAGSLLSANLSNPKAWFHVDAADHLGREASPRLREKLDKYIQSEGQDPTAYPFVYLITAPRILGYCFNPVSFWYLYSEKKRLAAMVLEVNNTFDERRMYFLKAANDHDDTVAKVFHDSWKKDFHVSPFNDREGSYALHACDIFQTGSKSPSRVFNRIVLKSLSNETKLMASLSSVDDAIEPSSLGVVATARVLVRYGWSGFLTFPRVVREAYTLYFDKKLRVWFRPEVADEGTIPRQYTESESILEDFFLRWLTHLTSTSAEQVYLTYKPAPGAKPEQRAHVFGPESASGSGDAVSIQIQPLSPVFYSRFVHYAHSMEAFDIEFLCTDEKNRTVKLSQPRALPKLFSSKIHQTNLGKWPRSSRRPGALERLRWQLLKRLRCAPQDASYPSDGQSDNSPVYMDIRNLPFSQMDLFVRSHCRDSPLYQRQLLRKFIAGRFTFHQEQVVDAIDIAFRMFLTWCAWGRFLQAIFGAGSSQLGTALPASMALGFLQLTLVHQWSFVKGL